MICFFRRLGYLPKILKEAQKTARVATKRERRADKNMRDAEQRARVAENNELQQFRRMTEATAAMDKAVKERDEANAPVKRFAEHCHALEWGGTDPTDPRLLRSDLSAFVAGAPESRGTG